ncbi:MAG: hypothetical protein OSA49_14150 [Ascidiaceihabitans sp.]|nr:hypothetical protein [Ascidiaceihabitans sp.]
MSLLDFINGPIDAHVFHFLFGGPGLASARMNDQFSRRSATMKTLQLQQFSCCERTQRKTITSAVGSLPPFAASCMKGRFEKLRYM